MDHHAPPAILARPPSLPRLIRTLLLLTPLLGASPFAAHGGPITDRMAERREARQNALTAAQSPAHKDVAYGSDPSQTLDVYVPTTAVRGAPAIFMVHGGAWAIGDKASSQVVRHKAALWLPRGLLFISVNYRMLPKADPLEQARDVARALAFAQQHAASWGGDAGRFVLMGHSAGAHLVSLLAANPDLARDEQGAKPWLGTVSLDSAAFDVPAIMKARHARLYDRAFGQDPDFWAASSPLHQLKQAQAPLLAVCSSRRDDSCPQAQGFADKAKALGMRVTVLPQDRSHAEINNELGKPGAYTEAVEDFLRSLDERLAQALKPAR
ncbi:alpha/beta hydrolase [Aquabacterium soli]|uniref:Alpha/beta hydrolase n=1 Tax=Aquabacterium soli TaxID=2493092 RepID=A0A426VHF6_9BURK|nr:alpha/beta hydrolase [Aquabacterium soli]RRS06259.1 alpha/beta hydrolase [Aquabacterium soli]